MPAINYATMTSYLLDSIELTRQYQTSAGLEPLFAAADLCRTTIKDSATPATTAAQPAAPTRTRTRNRNRATGATKPTRITAAEADAAVSGYFGQHQTAAFSEAQLREVSPFKGWPATTLTSALKRLTKNHTLMQKDGGWRWISKVDQQRRVPRQPAVTGSDPNAEQRMAATA